MAFLLHPVHGIKSWTEQIKASFQKDNLGRGDLCTRSSSGGMWEVFLTWGALWGEDGERGAQQMVREEHPRPPASLQGRADGVWGGSQGSREGRQWGVLGHTEGESRGETAWGGQAGKGRL